ncbi:integration host factor, actinobacterial type [Dietzia sp. 179-F 9C3 NHS]|uniref:integration host factor, actinobacterial type n=1 Tax=Dietzia sp. 179-F 9C3 NHS TaxID=3374295 RepID=UPI003879A0F4
MPLPPLTSEQRQQALEKAATVRKMRAALKKDIAAGKVNVASLVEGEFGPYAEHAEAINKTKTQDLLQAMRGVGVTKAASLMQRCSIAENRRLGGLGHDQRRRLVHAIKEHTGQDG